LDEGKEIVDDIILAEMCIGMEYKPGAKLVFDDVLSRPYLPCVVRRFGQRD